MPSDGEPRTRGVAVSRRVARVSRVQVQSQQPPRSRRDVLWVHGSPGSAGTGPMQWGPRRRGRLWPGLGSRCCQWQVGTPCRLGVRLTMGSPALASTLGGTQHPRSASRWEAAAQGRSPRGLWVSAAAAFTDTCRGHLYLAGSRRKHAFLIPPPERPDPSLATPGLLSDPGSASAGRFMKTASLTVWLLSPARAPGRSMRWPVTGHHSCRVAGPRRVHASIRARSGRVSLWGAGAGPLCSRWQVLFEPIFGALGRIPGHRRATRTEDWLGCFPRRYLLVNPQPQQVGVPQGLCGGLGGGHTGGRL